MGNDLRKVPSRSKNILLNKDAIAINQDGLGQMGLYDLTKRMNRHKFGQEILKMVMLYLHYTTKTLLKKLNPFDNSTCSNGVA